MTHFELGLDFTAQFFGILKQFLNFSVETHDKTLRLLQVCLLDTKEVD